MKNSTLLFLTWLLLACSPGGKPSRDPEAFNVLILVLDSLRADKLSCYGFERETSPNLDQLAKEPETVVYEKHHAPAPWTKPSTASLFTGLFAFQHGVMLGHKPKDKVRREYRTQTLDETHDTLAERMKRAGFHTFGVVTTHHLVQSYGFSQGFDEYISPADDVKGDDNLVAAALGLVDRSPGRFFGYLHLNAVHYPWATDKRDFDYMQTHGFPYDEAKRIAAGIDFTTSEIAHAINDEELDLEPDDTRFLNLLYESSIRAVDRVHVKRVIDGLKEAGVYDSTMLIVTSDHGEELYDHHGYAHGHALWQEIIHIPLLVKFPRGKRPTALKDRVSDLTSTIDILPSIIQFIGETEDNVPGASIFDGSFGSLAFSELRRNYALIRDGYKIVSMKSDDRIFDLRRDGAELSPIDAAGPKRDELSNLATALRTAAKGIRTEAPMLDTQLDPKAIEDLKQLGYIR